jgi:CPA2 family monovalent cation:H+ antiporter-2
VLNATPGFAAALLFGWGATAAVFLGGITYISSSGVVAKLLEDLGRIGNRETPTVLSILIVEDLVMAVYLPVAAGLAIATGVVETVADITIALAAVAVAFAISLRFGATLSRLVFSPSDELLLLTVLGGGVLVAGGAEHLGLPQRSPRSSSASRCRDPPPPTRVPCSHRCATSSRRCSSCSSGSPSIPA